MHWSFYDSYYIGSLSTIHILLFSSLSYKSSLAYPRNVTLPKKTCHSWVNVTVPAKQSRGRRANYGRKLDLIGPCAQPWSGTPKQWCWGSPWPTLHQTQHAVVVSFLICSSETEQSCIGAWLLSEFPWERFLSNSVGTTIGPGTVFQSSSWGSIAQLVKAH